MQFSNRANARRHEKNRHQLRASASNISAQANTSASANNQPNLSQGSTKKSKNEPLEIDYTKPELYRHLLTPSKLQFILTNLNFLEQAQEMKCKCCNKQFPSYKFFMGHMRKKYHGLPRNVCFKCLRQFESKGQFIGHLKRPGGSCPNLYRLVMADDKIPKDLFVSDTNLRTPAKDILANRVYACALCDDTFRLKSDFREHVYRTHLEVTKNRETPNASCINCNESFTESAVRRRHFNNLDCIVYIVCNTCGEQFANQAVYLEHVYSTHLKAQDEDAGGDDLIILEEPSDENQQTNAPIPPKNAQKCPVCQKQYNNYYNVLRHMEAKHPDQVPMSYQCPDCPEKFAKQTYLREHLMREHNKTSLQIRPEASPPEMFACKADECAAYFNNRTKWIDHQIGQHDGKMMCHHCDYVETDRDEFEKHLEDHLDFMDDVPEFLKSQDSDDDGQEKSNSANPDDTKSYVCRICDKRIQSKTALQKHMIKAHQIGGELVHCTLCPAEFANDKGLKVHLWRCHEIREADYEKVLPPEYLDPFTQQQRKMKQEEEQKALIMINKSGTTKSFGCPLCLNYYSSRDELGEHQKAVHAMDDVDVLEAEDSFGVNSISKDEQNSEPVYEQEFWFQCRFCQRAFNSGKKLTIHMNSHQDSGGPTKGQDENGHYPCKECDIIYKSKKSLWVHKNKKHPRIPEPSLCDACDKTFFDKNELMIHMQQVHPRSIPKVVPNEVQGESLITEDHWLFESSGPTSTPLQPRPLSSDPNRMHKKRKRPAASETPDGQFACDMCPKAFSNANALQVHRGWHFRSPDGRKVTDPAQMWMPDQTPPSKVRRTVTPVAIIPQVSPVCPHCNQKFASQNNLRRHMIEVHKKTLDGNDIQEIAEGIHVDRTGECTRCNLTFSTLAEWLDHKITDAKNRKTSTAIKAENTIGGGGYEWNCEICLKIFTRKERLMQHMLIHLNDREMDPDVLALHKRRLHKRMNGGHVVGDASHDSEDDDENESESEPEDDAEDDMEDEEQEEDDDDEMEENGVASEPEKPKSFSCELCRVDFKSSQELRAHVADHFLNDGAMNIAAKNNRNVPESETIANDDGNEDEDEDDAESSSDESTSENSPDEQPAPQPEIPKVQPKLQIHRCRVCNAAFLDNARLIECMSNHQKPTSHKCSECQLYFVGSKQLHDHENLCHT